MADAHLLQLAEAPARHGPLGEGEVLLQFEQFTLCLGNSHQAGANCLQRPRIAAGQVAAAVAQVRKLVQRHGRTRVTWEVSSLAEPATLARELVDLGMRPAAVARATIMGLTDVPKAVASKVVVRRVATLADFEAHVGVTHCAFNAMAALPAELARIARFGAGDLAAADFVRYNALLDDEVIGAATATFAPGGVIIHSGSTLPAFRGRGVYSALVLRRWFDAVARGTPALVTRAGRMSRPILSKLGFRAIGRIRFLDDVIGIQGP